MTSFEHVGFIINNNKDYKKKIQKEIACNTAEAKQHKETGTAPKFKLKSWHHSSVMWQPTDVSYELFHNH